MSARRILVVTCLLLIVRGITFSAPPSYEDWAEQHFSASDLLDVNISGRDALLTGDVPNLVKYALDIEPYNPASEQLPKVFSQDGELRFQFKYNDAAQDITYVVETSSDLLNWKRGIQWITLDEDVSLGDHWWNLTYKSVNSEANQFFRLSIYDSKTPPASWSQSHFGPSVNVDPEDDPDLDGFTNWEEFLGDNDPNNYYSQGASLVVPLIEIVEGNSQDIKGGQFAEKPLTVQVRNALGALLSNAPVTFTVTQGGGKNALSPEGNPVLQDSLNVLTDVNGLARIYYQQAAQASPESLIVVTAGTGTTQVFRQYPLFTVASTTYENWAALHFTTSDLLDVSISGRSVKLTDDVTNLLKYALGIGPFSRTFDKLPRTVIQGGLRLFEFNFNEMAQDITYVVETSTDLLHWKRGSQWVTLRNKINLGGGWSKVTYESSEADEPNLFFRLSIFDGKNPPANWWETHFGQSSEMDPSDDPDMDGLSNWEEFKNGTDPRDAFNGGSPRLEIVGPRKQGDLPEQFIANPFTVRVRNASGVLIRQTDVEFTISSGSGAFSSAGDGTAPLSSALILQTDNNGLAAVFFKLSEIVGLSTTINAKTGQPGRTAEVTFQATVGDVNKGPAAPTDVIVSRQTSTEILVEWTDNSDNETAFYVQRSLDNQTWQDIAILPVNRTSYTDATADEANSPFLYRICSYNEAN